MSQTNLEMEAFFKWKATSAISKTIAVAMFLCMAFNPEVFSQEILRVKYGHDRKEYVRFEHPEFEDGQIHYKNGETSPIQKLNYDYVSGQVFVIKEKGDTVPIINKGIKYFRIGESTYLNLHGNRPTEIVYMTGLVKLGVDSRYKYLTWDNSGYIDYEKWESRVGSGRANKLKYKYDDIYRRRNLFYIIDENGKVYQATRSNILFNNPDQKNEILEFIHKRKTNFKSRVDLVELLAYVDGG